MNFNRFLSFNTELECYEITYPTTKSPFNPESLTLLRTALFEKVVVRIELRTSRLNKSTVKKKKKSTRRKWLRRRTKGKNWNLKFVEIFCLVLRVHKRSSMKFSYKWPTFLYMHCVWNYVERNSRPMVNSNMFNRRIFVCNFMQKKSFGKSKNSFWFLVTVRKKFISKEFPKSIELFETNILILSRMIMLKKKIQSIKIQIDKSKLFWLSLQ